MGVKASPTPLVSTLTKKTLVTPAGGAGGTGTVKVLRLASTGKDAGRVYTVAPQTRIITVPGKGAMATCAKGGGISFRWTFRENESWFTSISTCGMC